MSTSAFPEPVAAAVPAPLPYHRLALARARRTWWQPLLTGVLALAFYAAMIAILFIGLMIVAFEVPAVDRVVESMLVTDAWFDLDQPGLFVLLVVPLILMIPALLAASRIVQGRGVGMLWSVAGRIRWSLLGRTLVVAFVIMAAFFAASLGLDALRGEPIVFEATHPGIPAMLILVVLLVPFQAAAEEYVFRGYLMQLIGRWLRHPAFAILLPVPLFVLGHGYDIWGSLDIAAFAIIAGWLSWRTGGLEAAIAMHIANNVLIFVMASFSLVDGNATEGTPIGLVSSVIMMLVYVAIVARRGGAERPQAASRSSASRIV
ncbi:CPBP family intramembrane glutamic endopeptidase [uncultured Microbacterium sp.]|uniref:CPBP family intramembrane glutamic endopeptidase n=1 Tax=uncultured Microbacterium sp. TaxID=191216 RepID=UPI00260BD3FF|nr:CPBP family intramembrane glutamic endopeptidase [uncultured Microbacterium sp.]